MRASYPKMIYHTDTINRYEKVFIDGVKMSCKVVKNEQEHEIHKKIGWISINKNVDYIPEPAIPEPVLETKKELVQAIEHKEEKIKDLEVKVNEHKNKAPKRGRPKKGL